MLDLEAPGSVLQCVRCPGLCCDAPTGHHRYVGPLSRSGSRGQDTGWPGPGCLLPGGLGSGAGLWALPPPVMDPGQSESQSPRWVAAGYWDLWLAIGSLPSKCLCPRGWRECSQLIRESESGVRGKRVLESPSLSPWPGV